MAAAAPEPSAPVAAPVELTHLFPFVFVGCWNQPGEDPPRNKVAAAIDAIKDEIQYIVLGGDNVYPKPTKPNPNGSKPPKIHELSVFEEGMSIYTSIGKPIIPAFGNHNVDLINKEMEYFKVSKTYSRYDFAGNIHILVLDTNIIIDKEKSSAAYDEMLHWFRTEVSSLPADHGYFVVQHDPYFTARVKKVSELVNSDQFLDVLFSHPPIAILCADTHHYQHATIESRANPEIVIHQFIVGTGGANHDPYRPDFVMHEFQDGKYVFTQVAVEKGFGFLRIDGPDPVACTFIKVMDWVGQGGSRRSRKRRFSRRPSQRRLVSRRRKNATKSTLKF